MEDYISNLRNRGYSDWIPVFRIIQKLNNGEEIVSWIKMNEPLSSQLKANNKLHLTGINQFFDEERKLDFIDFIFTQTEKRKNAVIEIRKNSLNSFQRSKESFWKPIRKIIGQEKILAMGVSGFIQNSKGEIATLKRRDDGKWSFPAGAREIGELPSESIINEVLEETSLIVKIENLCCVYTIPITYPNGDTYDYLIASYKMKLLGGDLKINDEENLEAKWMGLEEAMSTLSGGWKRSLDFFTAYKDDDGVVII